MGGGLPHGALWKCETREGHGLQGTEQQAGGDRKEVTLPTEPGDGPGRGGDSEGKSELPGSQLCQRGAGEGEIDPPGG